MVLLPILSVKIGCILIYFVHFWLLFSLSPSLVIAYRHFIQLLRISPVFKDVFHDVGLIELSIDLLNYLIDKMETFCNPSTTSSASCRFLFTKIISFNFFYSVHVFTSS